MEYVLGVDGGGTKTELVLMSRDGSVLRQRKIGCTNHEHLTGGYDKLQELLGEAVTGLLHEVQSDLSQLVYAVFGLAGADTPNRHRKIEQAISGIGIRHFLVCNDAFLPIKAGCIGGVGISAVNGTGCTVAGIDTDGRKLQLGGLGELSGDCGGGDYLGRCACAAVYSALYKNGPGTRMTTLLLQKAHVDRVDLLFDCLLDAQQAGELGMRDLNRIVFEAANQQDNVATEILCKMGRENAWSIGGLVDALRFDKEISIVLAGSIWKKGEHRAATDELKRVIQANYPAHAFSFTILQQPPVAGALLWAKEFADNKSHL